MAQPFIDLAFQFHDRIADLGQVKRFVITPSQDMHSVIGSGDPEKYNPDAPRGTLAHSLMYIVAVALDDGVRDKDASYSSERTHRQETITLWRKITMKVGKDWTTAFEDQNPARRKFGGRMVPTTEDGTVIDEQVDNAASYNAPEPWRRARQEPAAAHGRATGRPVPRRTAGRDRKGRSRHLRRRSACVAGFDVKQASALARSPSALWIIPLVEPDRTDFGRSTG